MHAADLTIIALVAAFLACVILGAMWADSRTEQQDDDAPGFHHPENNGALPPPPKDTEPGRNGTPHRRFKGPKP